MEKVVGFVVDFLNSSFGVLVAFYSGGLFCGKMRLARGARPADAASLLSGFSFRYTIYRTTFFFFIILVLHR